MLPAAGTPGTDLPIRSSLAEVTAALTRSGAAVLVSPPGTGKTTLVPLAVADLTARRGGGTVVVAQPRRVAARAAARRMASLLGEPVGESVGFSVRGESRRSPRTRVEVVTTGLLVRRLQHDPELAEVGAIILDECHERHLDTDLALAFGVDVRANLRPELLLLAMSATTQADRIAAALGTPEVVRAQDALHPVEIAWRPAPLGTAPPMGTRVDPRYLGHVAGTVRQALTESAGDVLVFLPGAYEITVVASALADVPVRIEVIHGKAPAAQQDAVLRPSPDRRVVLATAIAESSITVPGVRIVVDAGLSREPRADLARGLGSLVTTKVSKAAATQRAGRAGREGPGRVYRCWSESDHEWLPDFPPAEISTADLTSFALELSCWGAPGGHGLELLDAPPVAAIDIAHSTLRGIGAVDDLHRVTPRGRRLTELGVHPRLARALLDTRAEIADDRPAEVVALLSADLDSGGGDDLVATWRALRSGAEPGRTGRWREEVRRLGRTDRRTGTATTPRPTDDAVAGLVVGLAFPERVARVRRADGATYLMAGGTAAELAPGTGLSGVPWLAIATADRPPGRRDARIRAAVAIDEATARRVAEDLTSTASEVRWQGGDVRATVVERIGAIVLAERPDRSPEPAAVARALQEGLRKEGLGLLRWSTRAVELRRRLEACHAGLGEPWPVVDDAALADHLDLAAARTRSDLQKIDLTVALKSLVPWTIIGRLDEVAPEQITVPSGSQLRVDYSEPTAPALSVRVQEVFGWDRSPVAAGRPIRLNLLSPGGRVVAITSDLPTFWQTGYPSVRAELRGRYPRHPWPEDPAAAPATRRANPRR